MTGKSIHKDIYAELIGNPCCIYILRYDELAKSPFLYEIRSWACNINIIWKQLFSRAPVMWNN